METEKRYTIQEIKRSFSDHQKIWVFNVTYMIQDHTHGTGELFYIHSFEGHGTFTKGQFNAENHKRIRESTFYYLAEAIYRDVVSSLTTDIEEIDAIERAAEKPPVRFHDYKLETNNNGTQSYDLVYSLGDSVRRGNLEVNLDQKDIDFYGRVNIPSKINSHPPGDISFSAWKEYVCVEAKKHSPLRLAMLDI